MSDENTSAEVPVSSDQAAQPAAPAAEPVAQSPAVADPADPEAGPVAGLIAQIEAMARDAEKAADAQLHAVLNDVHVMAADLKAKAARVKDSLQGEAGALIAKLHDLL